MRSIYIYNFTHSLFILLLFGPAFLCMDSIPLKLQVSVCTTHGCTMSEARTATTKSSGKILIVFQFCQFMVFSPAELAKVARNEILTLKSS